MKTKGVSHIALGVRDMEKALRFYRDLLGFRVVRDEIQETQGTVLPALYKDPHERRRVVTLRWKEGKEEAFLVLSEHTDRPVSGEAIKLDQIGIHHFALWVEDVEGTYRDLCARGAEALVPPTVNQLPEGKICSAFFRDPDGIIVQLDEMLS